MIRRLLGLLHRRPATAPPPEESGPAPRVPWSPTPETKAAMRKMQPDLPPKHAPSADAPPPAHGVVAARPSTAGPAFLGPLMKAGLQMRDIGDGILSVMPAGDEGASYDSKAALYDHIVGSPVYTRIAWDNSPADYTAFAQRAHDHDPRPMLDVGCGTLGFTAAVYATAQRPVVLVDRSLSMLRRAKERIVAVAGAMPKNVVLLQGDVYDLPFRPGAFGTVAAHGLIHLFDDPKPIAEALTGAVADDGRLFLSSLVHGPRAIGDGYLSLIHGAGEVGTPKTADQITGTVADAIGAAPERHVVGNMAFLEASRQS